MISSDSKPESVLCLVQILIDPHEKIAQLLRFGVRLRLFPHWAFSCSLEILQPLRRFQFVCEKIIQVFVAALLPSSLMLSLNKHKQGQDVT